MNDEQIKENKMLAYHGKEELKQSVLAEMAGHRKAERLVQGQYWDNNKGCAVGCLLKSSNHSEYEGKFGIPAPLAHLEDRIFEGLPKDDANLWPERFLGAIKTGADLSEVTDRLMYWLMTDPKGIRSHATPNGLKAIKQVANLYKRKLEGEIVEIEEWIDAQRVAAAAVGYAAAAAAAAPADATDAAAYAAAAADAYADAIYAAGEVGYAAAAAVAVGYAADAVDLNNDRGEYYMRIADKLIEILDDTKALKEGD